VLLPTEGLSITSSDLWWLAAQPSSLLAWTSALAIFFVRSVRRRPDGNWFEQSDELPILFWALFATNAHVRSFDIICQAGPDPPSPDWGRFLASLGLLSLLFLLAVIGRWWVGKPRPLAFSLVVTVAVATVFLDHVITIAIVALSLGSRGL